MLRAIQDLVKTLSIFPPKKETIYVPRKTVVGDFDKLFHIIEKGHHQSEEDIARAMFGRADSKSLTRYFTIKSRLKSRIESALLFLDTKSMSEYEVQEYALRKELVIIWVLQRVGAYSIALFRLEKAAETSYNLGLWEILFSVYSAIRDIHAQSGSMLLTRKYQALALEMVQRQSEELDICGILAKLKVIKQRETFVPASAHEDCKKVHALAQRFYEKAPLAHSRLLLAEAEQYVAESEQNIVRAKNHLVTAIHDVQIVYSRDVEVLLTRQMQPYFLALRDSVGARSALQSLTQKLRIDDEELLLGYEYALHSAFAACDGGLAIEVWKEALQTQVFKRYARKNSATERRWKLFEVFLRISIPEAKSEAKLLERPTLFKPRFSMSNATQGLMESASDLAEQEKNHLLIALHCAQFLQAAKRNNLEEIKVSCSNLLEFQEEYLRKNSPTYRLQCFLRLVEAAQNLNFDVDAIVQKTRKHCEWLVNARFWDTVQLQTLEIIRYEDLWLVFLYALKNIRKREVFQPFAIIRSLQTPLHFYHEQ
jgi:hypothetical protein